MADIFLSYAAEDRSQASAVAQMLQDAGFSVWWDRNIHGGAVFNDLIGRELAASRAVVVLWSEASVESEWVRDEAAQGRDSGKLVPVTLDETLPPLGFRQRQAIDFSQWRGSPTDPAFAKLTDSLDVFLGGRRGPVAAAASGAAPRAPGRRVLRAALAVAAILIAAIAVGWFVLAPARTTAGSVSVVPFQTTGRGTAELAASLTEAVSSKLVEKAMAVLPPGRSEFQLGGSVGSADGEPYADLTLADSSGSLLWSRRLFQKQQTAAVFQEYAARRAAWALSCALQKRRRANEPVSDELFARVVAMCDHFMAEEYLEYFAAAQQFLRLAPHLSIAHAEMATATRYVIARAQSESKRESLRPLCRSEAEAALEQDPGDPWANFVMGDSACGPADIKAQEAHLRRGMAAGSEFSPAWPTMMTRLWSSGRLREAADVAKEGSARFPESDYMPEVYAVLLAAQGQRLEAAKWFARARAMNPPDYRSDAEVAAAAFYGDPDAVPGLLEELVAQGQLDPADAACWQDFVQARRTSRVSPASAVSRCVREDPASVGIRIRMLAALGDVDGAFRLADELFPDGAQRLATVFFYPEMREFRRDSRFWPLAARLGLVELYQQVGEWPDFCAEPGLPYDCKTAAMAALGARRR